MPHAAGNKDRFSRVLDALNWGIPEIQHAWKMTITRDGISIEWSMHQYYMQEMILLRGEEYDGVQITFCSH